MRIKKTKEFWNAKSSKKMKKIGVAMGAMGTIMGGGSAFGLPSWVGIVGFCLMIAGAFLSNIFTDEPV